MIPFSATFSAVAVSADQELFTIVAPSTGSVAIRKIVLGQYSDFGDAAAELCAVQIIRGYTAVGSGGAAVTPTPLDIRRAAFGGTVRRNDTTIASTGTPLIVAAETFNVAAGWYWRAPDGDQLLPRRQSRAIWMTPSDIVVVRLLADPTDALTMMGTIEFDEMEVHDVDK